MTAASEGYIPNGSAGAGGGGSTDGSVVMSAALLGMSITGELKPVTPMPAFCLIARCAGGRQPVEPVPVGVLVMPTTEFAARFIKPLGAEPVPVPAASIATPPEHAPAGDAAPEEPDSRADAERRSQPSAAAASAATSDTAGAGSATAALEAHLATPDVAADAAGSRVDAALPPAVPALATRPATSLASSVLKALESSKTKAPTSANDDVAAQAAEFLADPGKPRVRHLFVSSPPGVGKTTLITKLLTKIIAEEGDGGINVKGFITEEVRDEAGQRSGFDLVKKGRLPANEAQRCSLARLGTDPPKVGKYTVDLASFERFALPAISPPPPPDAFILPVDSHLFLQPSGNEEVVRLLSTEEEDDEGEGGKCLIHSPSQGELIVEMDRLRPVPEGWRPPGWREPEDDKRPILCICDEVGKMGLLSLKFQPVLFSALDCKKMTVLGTLPQPAKNQRDPETIERIKKRPDARLVRMTRGNRDALVDQAYSALRECLGLGPAGTGTPLPDPEDLKKMQAEAAAAAERLAKAAEEARLRQQEEAAKEAERVRKAEKKQRKEAKAKRRAARESVFAKKNREERKTRAETLKRAREAAVAAGVMEVGDEDAMSSVEALGSPGVEDLDDLASDGVEDLDVAVDVDDAAAAAEPSARKVRRVGGLVPPVPALAALRPMMPLAPRPLGMRPPVMAAQRPALLTGPRAGLLPAQRPLMMVPPAPMMRPPTPRPAGAGRKGIVSLED